MKQNVRNRIPGSNLRKNTVLPLKSPLWAVLLATLALPMVTTPNATAAIIINSRISVGDPSGFATSDGNGLGYTCGLGTDAFAEVRLVNSATVEVYDIRIEFPLDSGSIPFSQQVTLAPGDYSLHMKSYSHNPSNGESSFAWDASMSVGPEPSTVLLTLLGSLELAMRRRCGSV